MSTESNIINYVYDKRYRQNMVVYEPHINTLIN